MPPPDATAALLLSGQRLGVDQLAADDERRAAAVDDVQIGFGLMKFGAAGLPAQDEVHRVAVVVADGLKDHRAVAN